MGKKPCDLRSFSQMVGGQSPTVWKAFWEQVSQALKVFTNEHSSCSTEGAPSCLLTNERRNDLPSDSPLPKEIEMKLKSNVQPNLNNRTMVK